MTQAARASFHRYHARSPGAEPWGLAVTAGGRQVVRPGDPYPPTDHPADHVFRWETGRVLGAAQVVYISAGSGRFDSRETGLVPIAAGTALVILPGVWHRYAPDPATGWVEDWIEFEGATLNRLRAGKVLTAERAVIPVTRTAELAALIAQVHARLTGRAASALDPERTALGLQVLALLSGAPSPAAEPRAVTAKMIRAEQRLAESADQPPAMPALARELGIAYSYFRREFKRHTGLSPYQYVQQLRLDRARRMIGSSTDGLQTVADRLGYSSAYHLSAAFKKHYGVSPARWRRGR